jgi:AraC-like DNA-binding protein
MPNGYAEAIACSLADHRFDACLLPAPAKIAHSNRPLNVADSGLCQCAQERPNAPDFVCFLANAYPCQLLVNDTTTIHAGPQSFTLLRGCASLRIKSADNDRSLSPVNADTPCDAVICRVWVNDALLLGLLNALPGTIVSEKIVAAGHRPLAPICEASVDSPCPATARATRSLWIHNLISQHLLQYITNPSNQSLNDFATPLEWSEAVAKAARLMRSNLAHAWTIPELCRRVHMSRSSFCETFARITGVPPMRYLTQHRMRAAQQLFTNNRLPLKTILSSVGYASRSAFSSAFKREFGKSPMHIRKLGTTPDPPYRTR